MHLPIRQEKSTFEVRLRSRIQNVRLKSSLLYPRAMGRSAKAGRRHSLHRSSTARSNVSLSYLRTSLGIRDLRSESDSLNKGNLVENPPIIADTAEIVVRQHDEQALIASPEVGNLIRTPLALKRLRALYLQNLTHKKLSAVSVCGSGVRANSDVTRRR